ncbi:MAG TPA: hypothetical protein VNV88_15925, partial [Candidatus Solibacter sp.]|nr:hypothetical protein [Candidatus Solibacter sp.]
DPDKTRRKWYGSRVLLLGLTVFLIVLLAVLVWPWLDSTHFVDSLRWHRRHGNRAEIAGWSFTVPRSWYLDSFKDDVYLSRVSFFEGETGSSIYVSPTPAWAFAMQAPQEWQGTVKKELAGRGYAVSELGAIQIQGETGICTLGFKNQEYDGQCLFRQARLFVSFTGPKKEYLNEIAEILRSAKMVKSSRSS